MGTLYRRLAAAVVSSLRHPRHASIRAAAAAAHLERLEPRQLLAVSLDADGWTVVTPEPGQRTVYVSSSVGDDRNDGLTTKHPVRSLSRGVDLLRDGHGDRLLLRAGDVWYSRFPEWKKSGESANEPIVVSSYGPGERPIIKSGEKSAFHTGRRPISYVKLIRLHFHAHTRDPYSPKEFTGTAGSDGLRVLGPTTNFHVEDCVFDAYEKNVVLDGFYGRLHDVTFRRSVFTDGTGSGLYAHNVEGLLLEENVFDHNGYNELLPGFNNLSRHPGHNVYLQPSVVGAVLRGNLFSDAGSHGVQARSGGVIQDNLFIGNPVHLSFGYVNGASIKPGGVEGTITGNVFLGGRDIAGQKRGWAMEITNTRRGGAGTLVKGNVFAHDTQKAFPAIRLGNGENVKNKTEGVGINDLRIEGNIVYKWQRAIGTSGSLVDGGSDYRGVNGLSVRDNHFQMIRSDRVVDHGADIDGAAENWAGNAYWRAGNGERFRAGRNTVGWGTWHDHIDTTGALRAIRYFAPERTLETYNAVLGGARRAKSFLAEARLQSRRLWRDQYATAAVMEYVKSGFNLVTGPPRVVVTTLDGRWAQKARRRLVIHFNQDVSATLDKADLVVANRDTGRIIRVRDMNMTYDRINHVAVWTFPGISRGLLPAGRWRVRLLGDGIRGSGKSLDGNGDGLTGDDWTQVFRANPVA